MFTCYRAPFVFKRDLVSYCCADSYRSLCLIRHVEKCLKYLGFSIILVRAQKELSILYRCRLEWESRGRININLRIEILAHNNVMLYSRPNVPIRKLKDFKDLNLSFHTIQNCLFFPKRVHNIVDNDLVLRPVLARHDIALKNDRLQPSDMRVFFNLVVLNLFDHLYLFIDCYLNLLQYIPDERGLVTLKRHSHVWVLQRGANF